MATTWGVALDCARPDLVARFWALALGYVEPDWALDASPEERAEGAFLVDPDGVLPTLSLLHVPEGKVAKNRVHIDVKVGGGRHVPWETRWPRVTAAAERLVAAGARIVHEHQHEGKPDHLVMHDPEGNEFCLV